MTKVKRKSERLNFLPFNLATDTILVNYQSPHQVSLIDVQSYHHLNSIIQQNGGRQIFILCEEENIQCKRASWLSFLEHKEKQKCKEELMLSKVKEVKEKIESGIESNLNALMDRITERVEMKVVKSQLSCLLEKIRREREEYERVVQMKIAKAHTTNCKRLRMEIKGLQKSIERLEERESRITHFIITQHSPAFQHDDNLLI